MSDRGQIDTKPPPPGADPIARAYRRWGIGLTLLTGAIATADLVLGWGGGISFFVRVLPGYPAMVAETAVCVLLACLGTLALYRDGQSTLGAAAGLAILLIVALTHFQPLNINGESPFDTMSGASAMTCALLALRLVVRHSAPSPVVSAIETAGLVVLLIPLLGYAFDTEALFANKVYTSMGLNTAIALLAIFAALVLKRPDAGWAGVLTGDETGSRMARRLLPVIVLGPIVLGLLLVNGARLGLLSPAFHPVLLSVAMIASVGVATVTFARTTNRAEAQRHEADRKLKAAEAARLTSELAVAQAQKTQALGELVAGVAHDFNNTLMVVQGNLELMRDETDLDQIAMHIVEASTATDQATRLTRQLLAYGRKSRLQAEPVACDRQIEATLAMFRRVCPQNIEILTDLAAGRCVVRLDAKGFQQALLNLLINARDAMPDGGELFVSSSLEYLEQGNVSGFGGTERLLGGEYVCISIHDTGTGMDAATLSRADEPFFTTKDEATGSGLGLPVVSGFCRQSGGGLRLRSTLGVGTTVTMIFPLADLADTPDQPLNIPALAAKKGSAGIMLVDDDAAVTRVVARQLLLDGYQVRVAQDAESALVALKSGPLPDVVVSDLIMPGAIQGHALASEIRNRYPGIAVILMSGYESGRARRGFPELDAVPFLQKPVSRATLCAAIEDCLAARDPTPPRD